ncbi:hypothetical protein [Litorimonas haliclonae]|uniref:hypothetical protein n=1 Tax=Litorimonas haliclonae TaxID=2081977 RepID=UPI0039EF9C4C
MAKVENTENLSRQRALILMFLGSTYLVWQVPSMDWIADANSATRSWADNIADAGQILWALALLVLVVRGKRMFKRLSSSAQAVLEDDLVKAHRNTSLKIGYLILMMAILGLFLMTRFIPMTGSDMSRLIMAIGVATPLYTFAFLELHGA